MSPETNTSRATEASSTRTSASHAAPANGATTPEAKRKKQTGPKTLTKVAAAGDFEAKRRAGVILEVLAGVRTTTAAASALSVTLPRYYALEAKAIEGLVRACEAGRRGPGRSQAKEIESLRRENARLERECARTTALARVAQRTLALAPSAPASKEPPKASDPSGKPSGEKRPRGRSRPYSRALVAAKVLARPSATPAVPSRGEPAKSAGTPAKASS